MYKVNEAATHNAHFPKNNIGIVSISPSLKIKIARAIICKVVLNFAILDTGTLISIPAKNSLKPETVISLIKIINAGIVVQLTIVPFAVRTNITEATNILSAIGSKNVPNFVCCFLVLAS